ncbi:MAG: hypothetical protein GY798_27700 [Hyphomicrobiales bacterium]|nr:hypothetical protein [Hyphomicrobiales bacterium]
MDIPHAGPDRLEAAGAAGIPQIVSVGALDMVNFGGPATVPESFEGRSFYQHNPQVTLMRTTAMENAELGRQIAEKLNRAKGPTIVMLPRGGVSLIDMAGELFHDPDANAALFDAMKADLGDHIALVEMDTDINDPAFADAAAEQLLSRLGDRDAAS